MLLQPIDINFTCVENLGKPQSQCVFIFKISASYENK